MKKIAFLTVVISLIINPLQAIEKKNCSGFKKISKSYVACKSGNLKAGIVNTGSKIKKNTIGKIKKTEKSSNEVSSNEEKNTTVSKISAATKEKTKGFKSKIKKMFSGNTKQFPKGVKQ